MRRILFVNPFFLSESALERRFMTLYFPIGLLYLAAVTRQAGYETTIFDGTFAAGDDHFRRTLTIFEPEVVCFASLITLRPTVFRLAEIAKGAGTSVIVGGPDPSRDSAVYLQHQTVDVAVIGEGERTLVDLLNTLKSGNDLSTVSGIVYLDADGNPQHTSPQPAILDLDALPMPARDLINIDSYLRAWQDTHGYTSLTLAVSRGCPFGCEHCADSVMGPHHRRRTPDNVAAEMKQIEDSYQVDRFRLVDDLEGLGNEWLTALGQAMQASGVITPYEGLKPVDMGNLPMLVQEKDICAERNRWIPTAGPHPHAPPDVDNVILRRRWEEAALQDGEHLEDT